MQNDPMGQAKEFSAAALDAFQQVAAINSKLLERATQHQLELLNASVEASFKGTQALHSPEVMKGLAAGYMEKVLGTLRRSMEVLTEAQRDLTAMQKGLQQTASRAAERTPRESKGKS